VYASDAAAECEGMRDQLQPHLDAMTSKAEKKAATGYDLFVASRGGSTGRVQELQQDWDRFTAP